MTNFTLETAAFSEWERIDLEAWLDGVFDKLTPKEKSAWLDILALALLTYPAGRIKLIDKRQIGLLLGIDSRVLNSVLDKGMLAGKLHIAQMAWLKRPEDQAVGGRRSGKTRRRLEIAIYQWLSFPGIYRYHEGSASLRQRNREEGPENVISSEKAVATKRKVGQAKRLLEDKRKYSPKGVEGLKKSPIRYGSNSAAYPDICWRVVQSGDFNIDLLDKLDPGLSMWGEDPAKLRERLDDIRKALLTLATKQIAEVEIKWPGCF